MTTSPTIFRSTFYTNTSQRDLLICFIWGPCAPLLIFVRDTSVNNVGFWTTCHMLSFASTAYAGGSMLSLHKTPSVPKIGVTRRYYILYNLDKNFPKYDCSCYTQVYHADSFSRGLKATDRIAILRRQIESMSGLPQRTPRVILMQQAPICILSPEEAPLQTSGILDQY